MTLGSFGFVHPAVLLLLPLAALPFWGLVAPSSSYPSVGALPADPLSDWTARATRLIAALAIASTVVALAMPYRAAVPIQRFAPGAEIVLLFDRSTSMDQTLAGGPPASWWAGTSRTKAAVAQQLLARFAAQRVHDRIGLVAFSTLPIRVIAFTRHQDLIQAAIRGSGLGRGLAETDMGRALLEAISSFDDRPYVGSRLILLVSDGGTVIDEDTRQRITQGMKRDHISLYWLYLRSINGPHLAGAPEQDPGSDNIEPERALDRFFAKTGAPYRVYEAEDPHAVERAAEDMSRLEDLPLLSTELIPRVDLSRLAYAVALAMALLLLGAKALELDRWR